VAAFAYPNAFIASAWGMMVSATGADFERAHLGVMADFKERGWKVTKIDRLEIFPIGTRLAMLVADVTRYKTDDTVLERGRFSYTIRKNDDGWKILTATEVEAPFEGPFGPRT